MGKYCTVFVVLNVFDNVMFQAKPAASIMRQKTLGNNVCCFSNMSKSSYTGNAAGQLLLILTDCSWPRA